MMNFTHFRNLMLTVVCLFAGVQAQAQYSGSADQYPTTGYEPTPIEFDLSTVATALGSTADVLGAAINEYVKAETPTTLLFASNNTDWTATTTAANNGFWMAADGTPVAYGESSVWYCSPEVDESFTKLMFNVGQMPNVMKVGDKGQTTITLAFNEKTVTFALTLNVIAKPELNLPEPTVVASKLTIVGQQEVVVEQFPRGGYDSDPVKVKIAEALSLLGITEKAALAENIDKVLYATAYNDGDVANGGGMKKDSLTNKSTAGAPGWWVRPVQDKDGQLTGECSAADWGDSDRFFVEAFSYNAETDTLQCNLGQYPGQCKENEEYFTQIYIIYGSKAYVIKYTLKIGEQAQGSGLTSYTKVGETSLETSQEPTNDYSTTQVKIDVETIATALGCEVASLGVVTLDDKDNFANSTANNGGWWFSKAGTVVSYGSSAAFFIEPVTANDWSVINVGQYPDVLAIGDEVKTNLNFVNGTNYYPVTITLKVKEPEKVEYNFESVETRSFAVQALPLTDYSEVEFAKVDLTALEGIIGTTSPTLYGLNNDSIAAIKGDYSNAYSCDPKPGFWLDANGRVSVWADANTNVAVCYHTADGALTYNQKPNAMKVGDVFRTQLFLVNEENSKMVTLNITINFVESLEEKEVVGEETIVIPVSSDEQDTEIDLSKAATALGVTVADLLSSSNYYLRGMAAGAYAAGANCENGLSFADNGDYDGYGNIYVYFDADGDKVVMHSGSNNGVADDFNVKAQFCFEVNGKQYVFYATLASNAWIANGISTLTASEGRGIVYDLQGRQVAAPVKGLYIIRSGEGRLQGKNGKKVFVR